MSKWNPTNKTTTHKSRGTPPYQATPCSTQIFQRRPMSRLSEVSPKRSSWVLKQGASKNNTKSRPGQQSCLPLWHLPNTIASSTTLPWRRDSHTWRPNLKMRQTVQLSYLKHLFIWSKQTNLFSKIPSSLIVSTLISNNLKLCSWGWWEWRAVKGRRRGGKERNLKFISHHLFSVENDDWHSSRLTALGFPIVGARTWFDNYAGEFLGGILHLQIDCRFLS